MLNLFVLVSISLFSFASSASDSDTLKKNLLQTVLESMVHCQTIAKDEHVGHLPNSPERDKKDIVTILKDTSYVARPLTRYNAKGVSISGNFELSERVSYVDLDFVYARNSEAIEAVYLRYFSFGGLTDGTRVWTREHFFSYRCTLAPL